MDGQRGEVEGCRMGMQDGDAVWGRGLGMQDGELGSLPASSPALAAGAELEPCLSCVSSAALREMGTTELRFSTAFFPLEPN